LEKTKKFNQRTGHFSTEMLSTFGLIFTFWTSGYYANTVGQYGNEDLIRKYVEDQGKTYEKLYEGQLKLLF
jgi:REP element-mobilizing transposase RayT